MCYAKPGLRCREHVQRAMKAVATKLAAVESGDLELSEKGKDQLRQRHHYWKREAELTRESLHERALAYEAELGDKELSQEKRASYTKALENVQRQLELSAVFAPGGVGYAIIAGRKGSRWARLENADRDTYYKDLAGVDYSAKARAELAAEADDEDTLDAFSRYERSDLVLRSLADNPTLNAHQIARLYARGIREQKDEDGRVVGSRFTTDVLDRLAAHPNYDPALVEKKSETKPTWKDRMARIESQVDIAKTIDDEDAQREMLAEFQERARVETGKMATAGQRPLALALLSNLHVAADIVAGFAESKDKRVRSVARKHPLAPVLAK